MCQDTLNARVYAKQKINLTWPNMSLMLLRYIGVAVVELAKETYWTRWGQWNSSTLRVIVIQTIGILSEAAIYSILIF